MYKTSLLNLMIRGITLGSKFILVFFMAKILAPEEIGIYGVFTVTVSISLYLLGMDYYIFNTREILASDKSNHPVLIRDQAIFHGVVYVVILPIILLTFVIGIIPWEYLGLFYIILILEHVSQETNRLLITFSRPIAANFSLFFRSGAWVYVVVVLFLLNDKVQGLTVIWTGWIFGLIIGIGIDVFHLSKLNWQVVKGHPINWKWIKRGVITALPFFGANIALKIIEFSDRYFIKYFYDDALVGVYTVYVNIANVVVVFVTSGVITILSPKIIRSFQNGELEKYRNYMKKLTVGTIMSSLIIGTLAAVGILGVIKLLDKPIYSEYLISYWIRILSVIIYSLSLIPHYVLYVRRSDKKIIVSSLAALFMSLIMNFILIPNYGLTGASISILLAYLLLIVLKTIFAFKESKKPITDEGKSSK